MRAICIILALCAAWPTMPALADETGVIISTSRSRLTPAFLAEYGFSCDQLWSMRNGLYARNGYRFHTSRAVAAFGDGGTTSVPHLTDLERSNVATIQRFERAKGCPP